MSSLVDDYLGNERTTGKLKLGLPVKGKLQKEREEDWFAVELEAGVTYYLHFSSMVDLYEETYGIAFFDPLADAVVAVNIREDEQDVYLEFTPQASGVYYAIAVNLTGSMNIVPYSLQLDVRSTPDDLPPDTAADLAADTPGSGQFEQAGDVDWFRLHAEQGHRYNIVHASPAISSITIVDANGNILSTHGFGFEPVETGDYYIAVAGDRASPYTIVARSWRDDFPHHEGTSGRLDSSNPVQGQIDFESDMDWLRVDIEQGKFYTFKLGSEHDYVFGLTLFDQDGNIIAYDYSFIHAGGPRLAYQAAHTGAVYLQVDRALTSQVIDYAMPYSVSMLVATDDIPDDPAGAVPLAIGAQAQGSLQMGSDRDPFRISAEAGVTYRIGLASDGGGDYLTLGVAHAATGASITSKQVGSGGSLEFTPTLSGEYVLTVGSAGGVRANTAYTLTAVRAGDDWAANATGAGRINIGGATTAMLDNTADRDWFAIHFEAGTTYWIDTTAGGAPAWGAAMRILDAAGTALLSYDVPNSPAPLSFTPQASGDYFVEVASRGSLTGSYAISAAIGMDDVGSTIPEARALSAGVTFNGKIEVGSDRDVFRLDVVTGQTYVLALDASSFSSASVVLTDAAGNPVAYTPGTAYLGDLVAFSAQASGPVYATVRASTPATYQLSVTTHRDDHPDTPSPAASTLTEGSSVTGVLEYRADRDLIHMQLDAHRTYVIKIKGTTAGNPLPIASFEGQLPGSVSILEQSVANGERTIKFMAYRAGDYFVELRSANQHGTTYTLSALPFAGDGAGPSLIEQSHPDHGVNVSMTERTITLKFSEAVVVERSAIVLRGSDGHAVLYAIGSGVTVSGDTMTIKLANFLTPDTYTLHLPAASIHDEAGNRYAGPQAITFSTVLPADQPASSNDVYVMRPGAFIDGGDGIDTLSVGGFTMFSFVSPVDGGFVVSHDGNTARIQNIERLQFLDRMYALDVDGVAGQAYRLYQASFDRVPDLAGLGFWIQRMDSGTTLRAVADAFISSAEFGQLYGTGLSDAAFAQTLYKNVLHRSPDDAGLEFWVQALQRGVDRADLLIHFSESTENQDALAEVIGSGFYYQSTSGGGF